MILDPKTSQRIFELAKAQQEELESPDEDNDAEEESRKQKVFHQTRSTSETDDEDDLGGQSGDELLEEEEYPELVRLHPISLSVWLLISPSANRCRGSGNIRCIATP